MSLALNTENAANDDDAGAAINPDHVRLLEALLFASSKPLTTAELHERMPQGADVGGALMTLKEHYEGRGITLVNMDGQWAFRTAVDLGDALQVERDVQKKMSRAALETLAIIAYHQPVTRAEIENIRGVATHRGTVDALMEVGWIKPGRRRETPGRPVTWVTTPAFLDHFSLESVMDLPGMDDLKASGLLDRRPAIDAIPNMSGETEDLFAGQERGEGVEEDEKYFADDARDDDREDDYEDEEVSEDEEYDDEDDEDDED